MAPTCCAVNDRERSMMQHGGVQGDADDVTRRQLLELAGQADVVEGDLHAVLRSPESHLADLVAWAWVFDEERAHTLLVRHRRFQVWMPPGGLLEPGESPLDAACRELAEETGCRATLVDTRPALMDLYPPVSTDGSTACYVGTAYVFAASRSTVLRPEPGQPVAWHSLGQAPDGVEERHWARLRRHVDRHR
jgi:8-oxo-dGTP pyrophosphatase MutT (NUDIX family)